MHRSFLTTRSALTISAAAGLAGLIGACASKDNEMRSPNPFPEVTTVAVAPILNFSGEFGLDPIKAADLLASELSYVDGLVVLPVNRVVAVLASEGKEQIESPAHALAVAEAVGADAIIVAGITEYDAYTPVLGLAVQMYVPPEQSVPAFDAVEVSRQTQPLAIAEMTDALLPAAQVQRVYNGAHKQVVEAVRRYAERRNEGESPLGWRQYLKVQSLYLRFCWHDAIERLLAQQRALCGVPADGQDLMEADE